MTAAEILRIHNAWRRGEGEWADKTIADLPFTNQQLGEAIDDAVRLMDHIGGIAVRALKEHRTPRPRICAENHRPD